MGGLCVDYVGCMRQNRTTCVENEGGHDLLPKWSKTAIALCIDYTVVLAHGMERYEIMPFSRVFAVKQYVRKKNKKFIEISSTRSLNPSGLTLAANIIRDLLSTLIISININIKLREAMSYPYADLKFSFGKATTEGIMLMYKYMSNITATICPYSHLRKMGSQARYYKVYESAFAINLKCNIILF